MAVIRLHSAARYTVGDYDVLRALAIDLARTKVENAGVPDLTDNSTGVAAATIVNPAVPSAAFDATSSGGATRTDFNTAIDKIENAGRVLVNTFNNVRARIGLPVMRASSGTQAAADTIPAQDKSVNTTSGATSLDFAEGRAAMIAAKRNLNDLVNGFCEIQKALGNDALSNGILDVDSTDASLEAIANAAASATGASAISKAAADSFLDVMANNIATIASAWNGMMFQTGLSDLTNNLGGGSATEGLIANAAPALAAGAATTSAPKTGFDTELGKIENNIADLTLRMNTLRARHDLPLYTDSTGASANTTIESVSVNLTAVDGTLAANGAVDGASARARMATINNALSSLAVGINELADFAGVQPLTDALGGTASTTIANVAATAAAVGEDTVPGGTLLDSAVDTWLSANRDNLATLVTKLNAITGTDVPVRPMSVVAA